MKENDILRVWTFVTCVFVCTTSIQVTSKAGTFVGVEDSSSFNGTTLHYLKFLGVPYAEPPTGSLRFKKPVPVSPFSEKYDATYTRPMCLQTKNFIEIRNGDYSEDCLYLNIYLPRAGDDLGTIKLPVMVWIHGGGFVMGASDYYVADVLAPFGDTIVVTINYRLHVFGFISTGDEDVPGNFGLWDQHVAIKWVHDNIESFGGDPSRVTIFGNSAGGASVIYQALYPGNRDLFQRVIAQSGSSLAPWAFTEMNNAGNIASMTGCDDLNTNDFLSCMQELDAEDLLSTLDNSGAHWLTLGFSPVLDNDFITKTPSEMFSESGTEGKGIFPEIDLLSGVTSMEGAIYALKFWPDVLGIEDTEAFAVSQDDFEEIVIPTVLNALYKQEVFHGVKEALVFEYTNWTDPSRIESVRNSLVDISTDFGFAISGIKTADVHAAVRKSKKTFFYQYSFPPVLDLYLKKLSTWMEGANHGSEIGPLFGLSRAALDMFEMSKEYEPSSDEITVAAYLMTTWSNFAKSGDPNEPRKIPTSWPEYNAEDRPYMEISSTLTTASSKKRFGEPRTTFWTTLMPSLLQCDTVEATAEQLEDLVWENMHSEL